VGDEYSRSLRQDMDAVEVVEKAGRCRTAFASVTPVRRSEP
jgi:hypothetical protein